MIHRVCLFLANFSKALRLFDHVDCSQFPANNFEHVGEDQSHLTDDIITFQKQILNREKESSPSSAEVNSARALAQTMACGHIPY